MSEPADFRDVQLYAWIGEDDSQEKTGQIGLKQGFVAAGCIPLVAIHGGKILSTDLRSQMEELAQLTGVRRRCCRYVFAEVVYETKNGS